MKLVIVELETRKEILEIKKNKYFNNLETQNQETNQ